MNRLVYSSILIAAIIGLGLGLVPVTRYASEMLNFPFGTDHGEGLIWCFLSEMEAGRPLYTPLDEEPWFVCNYPPIYLAATSQLSEFADHPLFAGRALSMAAAILSAIMIAISVALIAEGARREARVFAAIFAGLAFLNNHEVVYWGAIMRIDMLALSFSLTGFALLLYLAERSRLAYFAVFFLILAAWTKPTMVLAAAGGIGALLIKRRARGLELGAIYLGGGMLCLGALVWATQGLAWTHLVSANANAWYAGLMWHYLQTVLRRDTVFVVGLVIGLAWAFWSLRRSPAYRLMALFGFGLATLITSPIVGRTGSNTNYLLEGLAAGCIFTGVMLARLNLSLRWAWGIALGLLLLSFWPCDGGLRLPTAEGYFWNASLEPRRTIGELILGRLSNVDGEILSEDMALLPPTRRAFNYHPYVMAQLAERGLWDPAALVAKVEAQEYSLLILSFDAEHPPPKDLMHPPAVIEAAARRYRMALEFAGQFFHLPR